MIIKSLKNRNINENTEVTHGERKPRGVTDSPSQNDVSQLLGLHNYHNVFDFAGLPMLQYSTAGVISAVRINI